MTLTNSEQVVFETFCCAAGLAEPLGSTGKTKFLLPSGPWETAIVLAVSCAFRLVLLDYLMFLTS